jgi:Ca-activated chloride channel family protein
VMIFALARPSALVILPSNQGTVILTFDVSGSMQATDLKPNRLEAAKAAARTFVAHQPSTVKIGVVSFSDNASIIQAPTVDRDAVLAAIDRLAFQRATAIGTGVLVSLDAIFGTNTGSQFQPGDFGNGGFSRQNQTIILPTPTPAPTQLPSGTFAPAVIVLLSDGQSNRGPRPLDVVGQALDRGVRVYTVGIGSPEGTILNIRGRSIRVRLDEQTLKEMSAKTDGAYFRANNETDLTSIYQNLSTKLELKPERTEITAIFTGAAILFLLAAGVLSLLWFNRLP